MSVHQVRLSHLRQELQFRFTGTIRPEIEELIVNTIDHFYQVTGSLYDVRQSSMVYSVHLDTKGGNNFQKRDQIHLNPSNLTAWTVTHELAHSLDAAHGWQLSQQMKKHTGSGFPLKALHYAHPGWKVLWYRVGSPPPPCGIDRNFNSLEDFAETVTAFIFPEEAYRRAQDRGFPYEKWGYTHFHDTPRGQFFKQLIDRKIKTTLS